MKVGGSLLFLTLIVIAFFKWYNDEERRTQDEKRRVSPHGFSPDEDNLFKHRIGQRGPRMEREKRRLWDAIWIPAASVFFVGLFAIGLGVVFTTIYVNTELKQWGVIILGVMLVVGVPVVAAYLERKMGS